MFVNGASPSDPTHSSFTQPNFPTNEPPMMQSTYLPFGWNPDLTGANANSDSYHDLIERRNPALDDDISSIRFYNQADYRVIIDSSLPDPDNIVIYDNSGNVVSKTNGDGKAINEALTNSGVIDQAIIQDVREGGPILVTSVNIGDISSKTTLVNGMVYISDVTAGSSLTKIFSGTSYTTSKRAIRLKNGAKIAPVKGLTFVSENPVYIQGNYNTGDSPPSNTGTYTNPIGTDSGNAYTWKPCAIVADAINVLSNAWTWDNSATTGTARVASNTTINAALVTGNVASDGTNYSGGGENFIRFLENWSGQSFTYYGSMVQFWKSKQATGPWSSSSTVYTAPTTNKWFYDIHFAGDPSNPAGNANPIPPGNPGFQLAAYLQQQRWYQVY
jgi:hypothetical protein